MRDVALRWLPAGLLLLGACTAPTVAPEFEPGPTETVDIAAAVRAFEDICFGLAPDLSDDPARFRRNGFVEAGRDDVYFDRTGTISVRIGRISSPRGDWRRCSVVYQDPNRFIAREKVDAMIMRRGDVVREGAASNFADPAGEANRQGRSWKVEIEGRQGELLDVPSAGRGTVGVLVLQFPS